MRTECFYLWASIWLLAMRDVALAGQEGNNFRLFASLALTVFAAYRAWRTGK